MFKPLSSSPVSSSLSLSSSLSHANTLLTALLASNNKERLKTIPKTIKDELKRNPFFLDVRFEDNQTFFHYLIEKIPAVEDLKLSSKEILLLFQDLCEIEEFRLLVDKSDCYGKTIFHYICQKDKRFFKLLQYLLKLSKSNIEEKTDNFGNTPLHIAVKKESTQWAVEILSPPIPFQEMTRWIARIRIMSPSFYLENRVIHPSGKADFKREFPVISEIIESSLDISKSLIKGKRSLGSLGKKDLTASNSIMKGEHDSFQECLETVPELYPSIEKSFKNAVYNIENETFQEQFHFLLTNATITKKLLTYAKKHIEKSKSVFKKATPFLQFQLNDIIEKNNHLLLIQCDCLASKLGGLLSTKSEYVDNPPPFAFDLKMIEKEINFRSPITFTLLELSVDYHSQGDDKDYKEQFLYQVIGLLSISSIDEILFNLNQLFKYFDERQKLIANFIVAIFLVYEDKIISETDYYEELQRFLEKNHVMGQDSWKEILSEIIKVKNNFYRNPLVDNILILSSFMKETVEYSPLLSFDKLVDAALRKNPEDREEEINLIANEIKFFSSQFYQTLELTRKPKDVWTVRKKEDGSSHVAEHIESCNRVANYFISKTLLQPSENLINTLQFILQLMKNFLKVQNGVGPDLNSFLQFISVINCTFITRLDQYFNHFTPQDTLFIEEIRSISEQLSEPLDRLFKGYEEALPAFPRLQRQISLSTESANNRIQRIAVGEVYFNILNIRKNLIFKQSLSNKTYETNFESFFKKYIPVSKKELALISYKLKPNSLSFDKYLLDDKLNELKYYIDNEIIPIFTINKQRYESNDPIMLPMFIQFYCDTKRLEIDSNGLKNWLPTLRAYSLIFVSIKKFQQLSNQLFFLLNSKYNLTYEKEIFDKIHSLEEQLSSCTSCILKNYCETTSAEIEKLDSELKSTSKSKKETIFILFQLEERLAQHQLKHEEFTHIIHDFSRLLDACNYPLKSDLLKEIATLREKIDLIYKENSAIFPSSIDSSPHTIEEHSESKSALIDFFGRNSEKILKIFRDPADRQPEEVSIPAEKLPPTAEIPSLADFPAELLSYFEPKTCKYLFNEEIPKSYVPYRSLQHGLDTSEGISIYSFSELTEKKKKSEPIEKESEPVEQESEPIEKESELIKKASEPIAVPPKRPRVPSLRIKSSLRGELG